MYLLRAAVVSAALMGSAVAAPVNISHFIDNPSGACSTCSFHPQERADAATAESESGEFEGKVSFRILGHQADPSHEKITSGSVKVTVYEVGVQHKVGEHSFDYWTCPRPPADCDACVGTYDTGEFVKFDDAEPCRNQKDFEMAFTLDAPEPQASGHFTLAITAQPANAQHTGGGLNAVWEIQVFAPMARKPLSGVPTPESVLPTPAAPGALPGVPTPTLVLPGVPTPESVLPGVPTPTFVLPGVPTPAAPGALPGVPTPTLVLPGVPTPVPADKPRISLRGAASDFEKAMENGDDDDATPSQECAMNPGYGECWGTWEDGVNKCIKYEVPGKPLCDCIGSAASRWIECVGKIGCYNDWEQSQCEAFTASMQSSLGCSEWPTSIPTC